MIKHIQEYWHWYYWLFLVLSCFSYLIWNYSKIDEMSEGHFHVYMVIEYYFIFLVTIGWFLLPKNQLDEPLTDEEEDDE